MTGTHAAQRKTVRDFKYPNDAESAAQAKYYREAREFIRTFHKLDHPAGWLTQRAQALLAQAQPQTGQRRTRLRNNARTIKDYDLNFSKKTWTVGQSTKLTREYGEVSIKITPDLTVIENGQQKLIKFDHSAAEPDKRQVDIICQVIYEAALASAPQLPANAVLYLDIARGVTHRGARTKTRMTREIEAACATISSIWKSI